MSTRRHRQYQFNSLLRIQYTHGVHESLILFFSFLFTTDSDSLRSCRFYDTRLFFFVAQYIRIYKCINRICMFYATHIYMCACVCMYIVYCTYMYIFID